VIDLGSFPRQAISLLLSFLLLSSTPIDFDNTENYIERHYLHLQKYNGKPNR